MRYRLPTDKIVNQLVPHFMGGRKYILFIQSLVFPLKVLNERFVLFAREKQIESRMTSQTMYFEWFLNHKFRKYFKEKEESIFLKESRSIGVPFYKELAEHGKAYTVWFENEIITSVYPDEQPQELYHQNEERTINRVSFIIHVPEITIAENEFVYMLSYVVNTYKIAGTTYLIKINAKEFQPINKN